MTTSAMCQDSCMRWGGQRHLLAHQGRRLQVVQTPGPLQGCKGIAGVTIMVSTRSNVTVKILRIIVFNNFHVNTSSVARVYNNCHKRSVRGALLHQSRPKPARHLNAREVHQTSILISISSHAPARKLLTRMLLKLRFRYTVGFEIRTQEGFLCIPNFGRLYSGRR